MANLLHDLTLSDLSSVHMLNQSHLKIDRTTARVIIAVVNLSLAGLWVYAASMESHALCLTDDVKWRLFSSSPDVNSIRKSCARGIPDVTGGAVSVSAGMGKIVTCQ